MGSILTWIAENKELMITLGILIVALSLTGGITQILRAVKNGLKETMTPLGVAVMIGILYIGYLIYMKTIAIL